MRGPIRYIKDYLLLRQALRAVGNASPEVISALIRACDEAVKGNDECFSYRTDTSGVDRWA
jgi:hypothetical protein